MRGPTFSKQLLSASATTMVVYFDPSKTTSIQIHDNPGAGTLAATVALASSNYPDAARGIMMQGVAPRWETETAITFSNITTGEGGQLVHVGNMGSRFGRLTITRTSGEGQVAVIINGRD
jgi:hypothetical protein